MTWNNAFSSFEVLTIIAFVAAYLFYIFKTVGIARKLESGKIRAVSIKLVIRSIYFALFIIALLSPSFGGIKKEIKSIGKDIYIAVDLSKSMDAFDIQPSRLVKVKYELKNIIKAFSSDRIGIIIFSSEAFLQCPLTYDQSALSLFIETLNTRLVPREGTDLAPALNLALKKQTGTENTTTKKQSKVIIIISDGEDFGENTKAIAHDIKKNNIKLFTLGVGTKEGSKIPLRGGFKRDKDGKVVISKLNSASLKELARITGGSYFEINKTRNDITRLINAINQIEGELRDTRKTDVSANKYYWFLILALLPFMVADVLFTVKVIKL
ncbi:MAG: VWA domain-containing protein [Cytophagales bacterium]|nr:VWA domain-containing protein [Cytophagales bacterium]